MLLLSAISKQTCTSWFALNKVRLLNCKRKYFLLTPLASSRVVVSVSTSRSGDGLETYFSNVLVLTKCWEGLGLKVKCLDLGPQRLVYKWTFKQIFHFLSFSYKTNMTVVQLDCICLKMIRLQLCNRFLCSSSLHHAARQPV